VLVDGINKFSGLIDGEAVCGVGREGEREVDETVLLCTGVLELAWELDKIVRVEGCSDKSKIIKEGSAKRFG